MYIVLVTQGKHESVDYATVRTFDDLDAANMFIKKTATGKQKYWVDATLVEDGEELELTQPER